MKNFFLFFLLPFHLSAANYYVSSNGRDEANGRSPEAAWSSIDKVNSFFSNIIPGDSILFRRGDIFYGALVISRSGDYERNIVISAYGTGEKPVITGFTKVSNWKTKGNGIWEANVTGVKPAVNLVIKDNLIQQVGRYPNANGDNGGYLTYTAAAGNNYHWGDASITSGKALTKNWTGAELVMKKKRWNIERDTVTGQLGNIIRYRQPYKGNVYAGRPGFGFFFQRHPGTLDQPGEWYYDPKEQKLLMYFGLSTPMLSLIKISTVDTLIDVGRNSHIVISQLSFEGANEAGIYSDYAMHCSTAYCDFNFMGRDAVTNWQTSDAIVDHCNINNALGSGIFIRNNGSGGIDNATVQYCTVKNTCQFAGMEIPGDAAGRAGITAVGGNGVTIQYNTVDSAGYAGIEWQGNDVLVYANVVSNCLNVRDDGGGIYSYVGNGSYPKQYHNRIIRKNIIINCIGASEGTDNKKSSARGIYCDEGSNHVLIDSNTIAYCSGAALYNNSVTDISMKDNVVFSNGSALSIHRFVNAPLVRNITVTRNYFFPYMADYANGQIDNPAVTLIDDLKAIGMIDSNYFFINTAMPFSFITTTTGNKNYIEMKKVFSFWQSVFGFDKNSKVIAAAKDNLRLEYNSTGKVKMIELKRKYKDIAGSILKDKIILQPFTSIILVGND